MITKLIKPVMLSARPSSTSTSLVLRMACRNGMANAANHITSPMIFFMVLRCGGESSGHNRFASQRW